MKKMEIWSQEEFSSKFSTYLENHGVLFDIQDPRSWNYEYTFTICVSISEKGPQLLGDHSFFQLKTNDGRIYSFGLYPDVFDSYAMTVSDIETPDSKEYHHPNKKIISCDFKITYQQFQYIYLQNIRHILQKDIVFQISYNNCTDYMLRFAEYIGLGIKIRSHMINNVVTGWYDKLLHSNAMTSSLTKALTIPLNVLPSYLLLTMRSRSLKQRIANDPQLNTIYKQSNPSLFYFKNMNDQMKQRPILLWDPNHLQFFVDTMLKGEGYSISSPYKLSRVLEVIEKERLVRRDPWAIPEKFLKFK